VKRTPRLLAALGLTLVLGACSPQHWINTVFQAEAPAATRVATCESGMNPTAISPTNDHGLFQINAVHRADFTRVTGQPWSAVYDARYNTQYAQHLYSTQGWRPWTCKP
jgi:hypothetical protein